MFSPDPSGYRDVALGVCRAAGRLLLVRNARSIGERAVPAWDLPGGAAHPGETLRAALAREWKEEVGLDAEVTDLLLVVDAAKRRAPGAPPVYTWRAFFLEVAPPPFGAMPTPGRGIERVEWVETPEAVRRLEAPYHAPLRAFLRGDDERRHAELSWVDPEPETREAPNASRLRRLLVIAAAGACGDLSLVESETRAALTEGEDRARIEETLLQLVPYAGFPRALSAFASARPAMGPSAAPRSPLFGHYRLDEEPSPHLGLETFHAVYADSVPRIAERLTDLHPVLPAWTLEFAYGRVLSRLGLALLDRELLAVSTLTALGRCDDALVGHARAALRLGASRADMDAAVAAVPYSAGEGKRSAARAVLARA
jgi:alkylhydroperoxidase/carboxymuconolactone decarboxylase family protein YurZ/ADP-ribose pyrophosphatase YjhB (NUDIX family)